MASALVIPDASVILKWVLPPADEADVAHALALRDAIGAGDVQALVPELWLYEVGNALARRLPNHAGRLLASLLRFNLSNAPPSRRWLAQVLDLTNRYGVTFYDAAYHAHAILEHGVFVTADDRYFGLAGEAGSIARLTEWAISKDDSSRRSP